MVPFNGKIRFRDFEGVVSSVYLRIGSPSLFITRRNSKYESSLAYWDSYESLSGVALSFLLLVLLVMTGGGGEIARLLDDKGWRSRSVFRVGIMRASSV